VGNEVTTDTGAGVGPLAGDDRLGPVQRARSAGALAATSMEQPLDVLVIGGGVVGCGAALDAAARGLSVGLVEMHDLAAGTSSRSSRLAHGGLRYLEQREFSLVHEALTERGLLLDRLAPHLVRPVPFLFPVEKSWQRPYVASGIHLYDMLSRVGAYGGSMPRPKSLNRQEAKALAPDLDTDGIAGAVRFHDAQIDDARHTIAVARTAAARGALIVTRTRVVSLLRDGERVIGARVRDELEGRDYDIYARVIIGAAGVWTDDLIHLADAAAPGRVKQSKGVHLVVPADAIRSTTAIIARTPVSVLFLLPWGRFWLVGTTDTPWDDADGDMADPQATQADIEYLLDQANRWLARPLTRSDVVATYSGLRPLLAAEDAGSGDATTTLSREHAVIRPAPGLVVIAGGKYTTYRVMAADVVDAAVEQLQAPDVPESPTADIPLVGADDYVALWAERGSLAERAGLSIDTIESLLRRHGDRITDVLELIASDPDLGRPLLEGAPHLRAEVILAVTHQGALDLRDVLTRRLRLALEVADHGMAAAEAAAPLVAAELGWSPERTAAELEAMRADLSATVSGLPDRVDS
jgi:glycerol-3-phosphate dehydrogenase